MAKNDLITHFFLKGMSSDLSPNVKSKESYQFGLNGRLYSENGIVNYTSIDGTLKVFEDENIVKILGYSSFIDELVLFVKAKGDINPGGGEIIGYEDVDKLISKSFQLSSLNNIINLNFSKHVERIKYQIPIYGNNREDLEVNTPISCSDSMDEPIDYSDYYQDVFNYSNIKFCQLSPELSYENNKEYIDAIISIKKDSKGEFIPTLVWKGLLNWDINAKIETHNVTENSNYKRIYFTDFQTPFKAINLKDKLLNFRTEEEITSFQSGVLLEPIIENVTDKGIIKSGVVMYAYRLITANGQITPFSSFSEIVYIHPSSNIFEGGRSGESTNKSVEIKVNLESYKNFQYIELISLEFQAFGSPTSIRQIGKKNVDSVVRFTHYGNEPEFTSNLTISEVLDRKTSWNYCSSLESKQNKLIAAGLRNDPLNSTIKNMKYDFMLHGWDIDGNTHNCFINPNPDKYSYINANFPQEKEVYKVKKAIYSSIKVFGNFTIILENTFNTLTYKKSFSNSSNNYKDWLLEIYDWLKSENINDLKVELTNGYLILSSADVLTYKFKYNTTQVIEDVDYDIVLEDLESYGPMIHGSQSLGFNKGNGIRITFRTEEEEVLTKATASYEQNKPLLNMNNPSLRKGFMKGEIYRLGINIYDKKGKELLTIPIGDIKIPEIGNSIRYLDDSGSFVINNSEYYVNSFVRGDKMYIQRIVMNVEVRMSCELQDVISMYKLVYVERSGLNKTILAQGVSAPLERVTQFERTEYVNINNKVANKWSLPPYGGPSYDLFGLNLYDRKPNGPYGTGESDRISTNRRLFYFDSPEFIFNKENTDLIKSCLIRRVGRLNIEYDQFLHNLADKQENNYPKFSRKVFNSNIYGDSDDNADFVNITTFLERLGDNKYLNISHAEELSQGQIIPGINFDEQDEISNNGITLMRQSWYYSSWARGEQKCKIESGLKSELFNSSNYAIGSKTIIIKTEEEAFSNAFINDTPFRTAYVEFDRTAPGEMCQTYSTHGLFNLVLNNKENVYGGRSERDLHNNMYISLSQTIPVNKNSTAAQKFKVMGDTFTTLYPKQKTIFNKDQVRKNYGINNAGNCSNITDKGINKLGAWCYVVAIETSVEPKFNYGNSFYKQSDKIDFSLNTIDSINEAYFQTNSLKTYIPLPYDFKEDPDMGNIISISDTKLNGDYIDSYLNFRVNNFYELEREKGVIYNLVSDLNNVYAIQENQTSRLFIDENTMVDTSNGQISIQQGQGQGVSNHQVISDFGTSIRRSVVSSISSSEITEGFTFFDEHKKEFVKTNKPMLLSQNIHLDFMKRYGYKNIVDSEGWYDNKFKESNIRLRFEDGSGIALSYNETMQTFNGYMNYNEDLYINWNHDLYVPKKENIYYDDTNVVKEVISPKIHQLNVGNPMNILDKQYNLRLKVTSNSDGNQTLIFKDWKGVVNVNYPIKEIKLNASFSGERLINGTHHRYFIKEGIHSVPLKNRNDRDDVRGNWMEMEMEIESKFNQKVSVFSITNFVRDSYQ